MKRLHPEPGETGIDGMLDQLLDEDLGSRYEDRPYVVSNFVQTLDGHITIDGRAGPIGSKTDASWLVGLRSIADAVIVGAGTIRTERYGRLVASRRRRSERTARGWSEDPLAVIVSDSLDLPWDAGIFGAEQGEVVIVTSRDEEIPETDARVEVMRNGAAADVGGALRELHRRGIGLVVCEGGPHLHGTLIAEGLLDELFVTIAPKLSDGGGPGLVKGIGESVSELELVWLLESEGELYGRWRLLGG